MTGAGGSQNPSNERKPDTTAGAGDAAKCWWCRRGIFVYDVVVVLLLLAMGVIYVKRLADFSLGSLSADISLRAVWFGALGGIVISLKGVYDHCCDHGDWNDCFDLWHFGRPISGGLTGLITLVLMLAINPKGELNEPTVYAIAFIFGTQERRFFNFLSEVATLVVRVPSEDQEVGLKGIDIQPSDGTAGTLVLITGRGFSQGASATIGDRQLEKVVVSKDGTSIVGIVPAGTAGPVDVTIVNPNGDRVILPNHFTYSDRPTPVPTPSSL